jgi:hypothetical protein
MTRLNYLNELDFMQQNYKIFLIQYLELKIIEFRVN